MPHVRNIVGAVQVRVALVVIQPGAFSAHNVQGLTVHERVVGSNIMPPHLRHRCCVEAVRSRLE